MELTRILLITISNGLLVVFLIKLLSLLLLLFLSFLISGLSEGLRGVSCVQARFGELFELWMVTEEFLIAGDGVNRV